MSKLIGIDTGGTFTDAVVFSETQGVMAKAKALTTRHDLSIGIGEAIQAVMRAADIPGNEVSVVSLSTTLATNAIVEGLGDTVGLVLIGFAEADLVRAGLGDALRDDRVLFVRGGHNAHGIEVAALDIGAVAEWLEEDATPVGAFAVTGQFSVMNPAHELLVRDYLTQKTGKAVTCSHELSAKLNAPKRALTSLLNARLIGILHHLIDSTELILRAQAVSAPLMVIKGDGSLISAAEARRRPIETILSGPAASIVGASYLTGLQDAVVADIGGTTTDVAVLTGGRPRLDEKGARVGGWSTMVEAVAIHTTGLGGDSEVSQAPDSTGIFLRLGPRRVIPVSLLAWRFPQSVQAALDRQTAMPVLTERSGRFAAAARRASTGPATDPLEMDLLAAIAESPLPLDTLLTSRRHDVAMQRLVNRGAVLISAFTPSDAAHVLGFHQAWDREAAVKTAALFARKRGRLGEHIAADAESMSRAVVEAVISASAAFILDASFAVDGYLDPNLSAHPLAQAGLRRGPALVRVEVGLSEPLIALGAAAPSYYPHVAERLNAQSIIPDDADVANAIGAVVGHVQINAVVTISCPSADRFRVHLESGPQNFVELAEAIACAEESLRREVKCRAAANGVQSIEITLREDRQTVAVGGAELLLGMTVSAAGIGRPAY